MLTVHKSVRTPLSRSGLARQALTAVPRFPTAAISPNSMALWLKDPHDWLAPSDTHLACSLWAARTCGCRLQHCGACTSSHVSEAQIPGHGHSLVAPASMSASSPFRAWRSVMFSHRGLARLRVDADKRTLAVCLVVPNPMRSVAIIRPLKYTHILFST